MTHSFLATPKATTELLASQGLYTKKSLGQHFLVDDNIIGRILDLAHLSADDVVVEVGPGIGTLTVALADKVAGLVAVERDPALPPVLREVMATFAHNFTLLEQDALQVSEQDLAGPFGAPTALVANLPYQVAATVVLRFFEMLPTLKQATVMVQAEVADRMAANSGTKSYGAYTVKLRLHARPAGRFAVARTCFLPPPRVDSAVIRLEREELASAELIERASRMADAAFAQRRKTLRNSLRATLGMDSVALDELLVRAGIDGGCRAETLPVEAFLKLAELA